ncbi:MAG: recombinase family protein [Verrucomicrobiota bacterium]
MAARSTGRAPFGFRWSGGALAVDEEKAAVRRLMFDLFLEHRTRGAVAGTLNEMGYPSPTAGKWTDVTVARLLRCRSAIGIYEVDRTEAGADGKRTARPEDTWRTIPCPPLISREVWDDVQRVLSEQSSGESKVISRGAHALSGLVHCACGETMTIPSALSKFTCAKCRTRVAVEDLESIFLRDLGQFEREHREAVSALLSADPRDDELHRELDGLRAERKKAESEIARGQQLVLDGKFSSADFTVFTRPLETALRSLRAKIRKAEAKIAGRKDDRPPETGKASSSPFVESVWPGLPLKTRQRIARTFVERFVVSPGKLVIHHRFAPQTAAVDRHTEDPTDEGPEALPGEPVYIRLPKPGTLCPLSGLTRAMLNELILPTPRNLQHPPVKSFSQRQPGKGRGVRLIVWASLKSHLLGLQKDKTS